MGFEDFFEITKYNERTIEPGCYYHPKEGLMFTSSFSEIPNQLFGISDKNVIKAVDKSYTNVESIPNNTFKFEGYLNPLSPKTRTAIRNLMEKQKAIRTKLKQFHRFLNPCTKKQRNTWI